MDWGLIGGLGEGLKSGVESYKSTKKSTDEAQAKKDALDLALKQREEDKAASAEKSKAEKIAARNREAAGLLEQSLRPEYDEAGILTGARRDASLDKPMAAKEKDPIAQALLQDRLDKIKQAKMLPADKVLAVQQGEQIPKQLEDIKATLANKKDLFGPIKGRLSSMNPYNQEAQTTDAQLRASSQAFGRYMEGGVLRKEDEEKYKKMFPQLSDTPEVAADKLAIVDRMLRQKQAGDVGALETAGYDTKSFARSGLIPDAPKSLGARDGLLKEAVASSVVPPAPKSGVVENGYKFKGGNPADPKNWEKVK